MWLTGLHGRLGGDVVGIPCGTHNRGRARTLMQCGWEEALFEAGWLPPHTQPVTHLEASDTWRRVLVVEVALMSHLRVPTWGSGPGHCGSEWFLRVTRPPLTSHLPWVYPVLPHRSHSPSGVGTSARLLLRPLN